jgi:60 kDa SS-A/Ro ribonucleoprotein
MPRFNTPSAKSNPRKTENYEGEVAYTMGNPMKLYVTGATSTLSAKFYEPGKPEKGNRRGYSSYGHDETTLAKQRVKHIVDLCNENDPWFVANLAEYIRSDMYLRSVPLVMVASLAQRGRLYKETVARVVQRPDEITELLAVWQYVSGRKDLKALPNALKKGLALAMQKHVQGKTFEDAAYGVGKYRGGNRGQVTFLDVMRLVHPRPLNDIQNQVFQAIKNDTIPTPYTWETELSAAGPDPAAKKKVWENLLDSGKLPYMAALRNIRNIIQADVSPAHVRKLADLLTNEKLVLKSKQFPFRWFAAYKMLAKEGFSNVYMKLIFEALERAIQMSVPNIPGFDQISDSRVLISCDTSSSMTDRFSANSEIRRYEIALVLGLLLQTKLPLVTISAFAEGFKVYPPTSQILSSVGTTVGKIGEIGHSTNGHLVLQWAREQKAVYDYVMLFSDMQLWNSGNRSWYGIDHSAFESEWNAYRSQINPKAKLVLFDTAGYATTPIDSTRKDVYLIAGFSEKVFQVLPKLAAGEDFLKQFYRPIV